MLQETTQPVLSPVDEYRNIRALSQSALKVFDYDVQKFYEEEEKWITGQIENKPERASKAHFDLGSMVDTLLTRPEDFKRDFSVYTGPMPKAQMLDFVLEFYRLQNSRECEGMDVSTIAKAAHTIVGIKRDSVEKMVERFKLEAAEYYSYLVESKDKITVPTEQYFEALQMVKALKEDEFTAPIVLAEDNENTKVFHQYVVQANFQGVPLKGLIDKVIIKRDTKTIQLVDYKTSSDGNFTKSFLQYRYDLQASMYQWLAKTQFHTGTGLYEEYTIIPFVFVVAFTTGRRPEVWRVPGHTMVRGMMGGTTKKKMELKGFSQLVIDYKWHKQENLWKYPREVYENHGFRILDCYE